MLRLRRPGECRRRPEVLDGDFLAGRVGAAVVVGHRQTHLVGAVVHEGKARVLVCTATLTAKVPAPVHDLIRVARGFIGELHYGTLILWIRRPTERRRRPEILHRHGSSIFVRQRGIAIVGHPQPHGVGAIVIEGHRGSLAGSIVESTVVVQVPLVENDGSIVCGAGGAHLHGTSFVTKVGASSVSQGRVVGRQDVVGIKAIPALCVVGTNDHLRSRGRIPSHDVKGSVDKRLDSVARLAESTIPITVKEQRRGRGTHRQTL